MLEFHSFACGCPVVLAPFIEDTVLFSLSKIFFKTTGGSGAKCKSLLTSGPYDKGQVSKGDRFQVQLKFKFLPDCMCKEWIFRKAKEPTPLQCVCDLLGSLSHHQDPDPA